MKKERYISREEQGKCKKVADAFAELYEMEEMVVVDAGRYGYVKLEPYYKPPIGFDCVTTYTNANTLFEDLWEEWLNIQIYRLVKGTSLLDKDLNEIFESLPEEKQREFMAKKQYFAEMAGMKIQ